MPTSQHPPFVAALRKKEAYTEAVGKVRFLETSTSYIFKAGEHYYKVKKTDHEYSNLAVKQAFCQEEAKLLRRCNGEDLNAEVVPINAQAESFTLGLAGSPVEYALKTTALTEKNLVSQLLAQQKLSTMAVGRIARKLAQFHTEAATDDKTAQTQGRPEVLRNFSEDMLYQMKRHFDESFTQPIQDMIRHPLERFLDEQTKLFQRRIKKHRILECHGALLPEHIHVKGTTVVLLSPQEVQRKQVVLDATYDVATFSIELLRHKAEELNDSFLDRYLRSSRDRTDMQQLLPLYQTFVALRQGVHTCEERLALKRSEAEHQEFQQRAVQYFNLAVRFARQLPH
jgi:aminoglycoside phosphotransferase family enzyme